MTQFTTRQVLISLKTHQRVLEFLKWFSFCDDHISLLFILLLVVLTKIHFYVRENDIEKVRIDSKLKNNFIIKYSVSRLGASLHIFSIRGVSSLVLGGVVSCDHIFV